MSEIREPVLSISKGVVEELRKKRAFWLERAGFTGERAPNKEQEKILRCGRREILIAGGERSGKSYTAACYLIQRWKEPDDEEILYWLAAEDYAKTRGEFDYLVEGFANIGVLKEASSRVDPGRIELAGGVVIETKSTKDTKGIAVKAPHGIVACEAGQMELEAYWKLRARLAEKRGWLLLEGTFEGSLGWFPKLFTAWEYGVGDSRSYSLPTPSNIAIFPGGMNDPEIVKMKEGMPEEFFMERIMGRPCPPKGLVFHEFRPDIHIREDIEWLPDVPVHLWVDPGYASAAAVEAVQIVDGQVRVFDEIYERGRTTEEVIDITQKRPWWKGVKFLVGDIAARQHQAMPAVAEVWQAKTGLYMSGQKVDIRAGIDRMKSFLKPDPIYGKPGLVSSPKCRGLNSELGGCGSPFDGQTRVYRYKTDNEGNVVGDEPRDENNHGVKAVIYGLVDNFGFVKAAPRGLNFARFDMGKSKGGFLSRQGVTLGTGSRALLNMVKW